MKPIIRYTGMVAVTAIIAFAGLVSLLGSPPADAQPAPTSDTSAVPAPTVQQVDKGAASSSAVGSDANPGPQPAAGQPAAGSAGGSAVAAPPAGPGVGSGSADGIAHR